MNLKQWLPLLGAVAVFSCQTTPQQKATSVPDNYVWYTVACNDGRPGISLCPFTFIKLFENGTFTAAAVRGYVAGSWRRDSLSNQLWLTPGNLTSAAEKEFTVMEIIKEQPGILDVKVIRNILGETTDEGMTLHLKATPVVFENDPFRTDFNLWREKPEQPESEAAIRQRVLDYLHFLKMFYSFAASQKLDRPDTDWFPNVLYMGSQGSVRMAYSNELNDWNACFYNEAQAIEAYKMLSGPIYDVKLKGNPDINERNADVADQLIQLVKKNMPAQQ